MGENTDIILHVHSGFFGFEVVLALCFWTTRKGELPLPISPL